MFNKFKNQGSGSSTYDYLVVGLGNPGAKYETTRHNAGFLCIEKMEDEYGFKAKKLKFHALIGDTKIANKKILVMKPQTMMNNSGVAISECASFYKIPPQNIIVIFDDCKQIIIFFTVFQSLKCPLFMIFIVSGIINSLKKK